jgi:membrane protease YdiL (CAAX protease family)
MSEDSFEPSLPKRFIKNNLWPPKLFGKPFWVILTTFAIFAFSQIVALICAGLLLGITHSGGQLEDSAPLQFVYILIAEAVAVGSVFWLLKQGSHSLAKIGWGRWPRRSDLGKGLLGFVVFFVLVAAIMTALSAIFPSLKDSQTQDIGFNNLTGLYAWVLAFVGLVILPPLGEETLIRGYLYSGLRSKWRFLPAMLVTSLLFGLAHLQSGDHGSLIWGAAIDTFILSIVLVYLRETTGALYAGVLIHSLNNLLAFFAHFHP